MIELQTPHRVRLYAGEVKITGTKSADRPLELLGPDKQTVTIAKGESAHYFLQWDRTFKKVASTPVWLAGYEGSSSNESLGSLIAKIDGRNVPLSVGFHKVQVEIRDQIARTTIEESFINRTAGTLEGVFHFPLPEDASISGFGMWIGGELIEADVVEKQRAREIYETILREKRDPGLLEWTGGNIFKARVYPIPAHSEKRIRIVYTQVLPLRGNRYRYSYGLRSELLRTTPLRELSLDVQIHSAIPIKSVDCPTHAVRSQLATHSAKLEFSAQEYTPDRDFEIVCELDSQNSDVVVIPHQRGEDGYFLVELTPPGPAGNWQRELLPDGKPLELLLVCDTSASMDSEKRKQQAEFVGSLLDALGPDDRFNLAACDVDCTWVYKEPIKAGQDGQPAIAHAQNWLKDRISLGWTNLDRMAESVLNRLGEKTHVIYIGDGIVTSGNADPQEFINRLKRLTDKKRRGTFHAVSVGNSFESAVLKAVARVGGGSVRHIGGEQTPQKTAFELLNEIAQPGLRDLQVEFRGLQVAAVYPEQLPNLAAGTQQILIGRYLPQGKSQSGEIIIRGERDGEPVKFAARIDLANAEAGNSFIPRLWARAHLDHLLAQGQSSFIKDQIIALSEEFHIITPYTSLLVLESDTDRERFGVKRRYEMRDGERFFAEGKDQSHMELLQQQMKLAGDWRLGLRRHVLARFAQLGRSSKLFEHLTQHLQTQAFGPPQNQPMSGTPYFAHGEELGDAGGMGGWANVSGGEINEFNQSLSLIVSQTQSIEDHRSSESGESLGRDLTIFNPTPADETTAWDGEELREEMKPRIDDVDLKDRAASSWKFAGVDGSSLWSLGGTEKDLKENLASSQFFERSGMGGGERWGARSSYYSNYYTQWIDQLFPALPNPPGKKMPQKPKWTGEALEISQNLIQPLDLKSGGLEIAQHAESRDSIWDRETGVSDTRQLFAPKRWLHGTQSAGSQTLIAWCTAKERGVASRAFQLGRVRKSFPGDLESFHPGERLYAVTGLHETYRDYNVKVDHPAKDRAVLTLTYRDQTDSQIVVTIDTERNVILEFAWQTHGKTSSSTKYSDYVQVGGVWWPGKMESFDDKSRPTSVSTQTVKLLDDAGFEKRFNQELPNRDEVRLLTLPLPSLRDAEKAVAAGSADFEDRLVLLLRSSLIQKWNEVLKQLKAMEELSPQQSGLKWIRAAVLIGARHYDEARLLFQNIADGIVSAKPADELFLANSALDRAGQILDSNEQLRLLDRLRPVFDRQPKTADAERSWKTRRAQTLRSLGRTEEVLKLQKDLAASAPWDASAQTVYAQDLVNAGDYEAAYKWLRQEIARKPDRQEYETQQLRGAYAEHLYQQGREEDYVAFLKEWIETDPAGSQPYEQYLSGLIFANRTDDADETAKAWLKAGRVPGRLEPADLARLNAPVDYALGQRYRVSMDWLDPAWLGPLEETAVFFLDHKYYFHTASRIIDNDRFRDSDEYGRVMAEVARRLKTSADTLPARFLSSYVNWLSGREELSTGEWKQIAETLHERWKAAKEATEREQLGDALMQIYAPQWHYENVESLSFLRERLARAEKAGDPYYISLHRQALFDELLSRDWREEYEAEAFSLIDRLSGNSYWTAPTVSQRMAVQIHALHRFVDRMLEARYQADLKKLQDEGHPEKLTRTELAEKKAGFQKAAREGVAKRLAEGWNAKADEKRSGDETAVREELLGWIKLERVDLDLKLGRDFDQAAKVCWDMLGDEPKPEKTAEPVFDERQQESARRRLIEDLRKQRAFVTLNYLAVRRSAPAELVARLKKYIAAGLKFEGDAAAPWKRAEFGLLIALDQPEGLERRLTEWIRTDPFPAPWQLALGRLSAERGKLAEAIRLFETVERESQLSPADDAAMANWYLALDRKADYRRAKVEVFKSMPEYQISNWIRGKRTPWYQTAQPLPAELDEDVLFAFRALFRKEQPARKLCLRAAGVLHGLPGFPAARDDPGRPHRPHAAADLSVPQEPAVEPAF